VTRRLLAQVPFAIALGVVVALALVGCAARPVVTMQRLADRDPEKADRLMDAEKWGRP
jgi:hypothetical protein